MKREELLAAIHELPEGCEVLMMMNRDGCSDFTIELEHIRKPYRYGWLKGVSWLTKRAKGTAWVMKPKYGGKRSLAYQNAQNQNKTTV